jgi:hypothetical protein
MKLFFGLFIVAAALYLGVELVPPYYTNYEFQDAIQAAALFGTNSTQTADAIGDGVFKKAQELEIPLTREQIKVQRVGPMGGGFVTIEAPYTVHLNLVGYPLDLHFDAVTKNKGVMGSP